MQKIKMAAFLSCLFFIQFSYSDIIKDDIYILEKKKYPLVKVCQKMLKKDYPLVSKESISKINCMGKIINAINFCSKTEVANPYLVRALVTDKELTCISSKKVNLKYKCKKQDSLCSTSESACKKLKRKLAYRLRVDQHFLIQNEKQEKIVSCYFVPERVKKFQEL